MVRAPIGLERLSRCAFIAFALTALMTGLACHRPRLVNDPNAHVPFDAAPTWKNWSRNLKHVASESGEAYYFSPTNRDELRSIVKRAKADGVELRVSGQRHSQPPLVADDNRSSPPRTPETFLVDLSCYADLGPLENQQIVVDPENLQVTVNAGVREDYLDATLAQHGLDLKTVTAGGFFSIGGMTAVDVHGATVESGIFAETVSAFTIMGPEGDVRTIRRESRSGKEWSELQFARVSLGALGIVTSVTIDVIRRPYANFLTAGIDEVQLKTKQEFIEAFEARLDPERGHDRIEAFFLPYGNRFLILWWNRTGAPWWKWKVPNPRENEVASSCTVAMDEKNFGAPFEGDVVEWLAQDTEGAIQHGGTRDEAKATLAVARSQIKKMFKASKRKHSDLWLTEATRVAFMSYFIELPDIDREGLGRVWDALQVVGEIARQEKADFRVAAPLEFRFVRGGDTALAGTYTERDDATFVNLDLLAFVPEESSDLYPKETLKFFSDVEREWYGAFGGLPHNGKMYGFHDPGDPDSVTSPFDEAFLADLAARRGERLEAFEAHREKVDPEGLFCNDYLRNLNLCRGTAPKTP